MPRGGRLTFVVSDNTFTPTDGCSVHTETPRMIAWAGERQSCADDPEPACASLRLKAALWSLLCWENTKDWTLVSRFVLCNLTFSFNKTQIRNRREE